MQCADNIGIMDAAYFVPRTELLAWVNSFLKLNVQKIEHLCTGAVYCQIVDSCYPGTIPMHKVNWKAKYDYEYVTNYKLLQNAFTKAGVQKRVEVERLIKGKYQDNLEFLQWIKHFHDLNFSGSYDSVEHRKGTEDSRAKKPPRRTPVLSEKNTPTKTRLEAEVKPNRDLEELRVTANALEKERDFYFSKLRDIEVTVQDYPDSSDALVQLIQKILYAAEDEVEEVVL
jgi:RP/EB family microtubule-associated protein